jgi:uncharacterized protein YcfL
MRNLLLIMIILLLVVSCQDTTKYKVNQTIKTESGNTKITTEVVKFENGAWLGTSVYSSIVETKNMDSLDIYIELEINRAKYFKNKTIELEK